MFQQAYRRIAKKRNQGAGMITAPVASRCLKCGEPAVQNELWKGWCLPCVEAWTDTVDPWVLKQAADRLPSAVVAHTLIKDVERLQDRITQSGWKDEDFLPLTQFMGNVGIGQARSMWQFLQAMFVFEIQTTGDMSNFGRIAPNTTHLCGRHAPVQRMSLSGFLSRVETVRDEFKLWRADKHFCDYMRGFVNDNRVFVSTLRKTGVDVYDRYATEKSYARYGRPHFDRYQPTFWPFEGEYDSRLRERGTLEELPDVVMQIGALVPADGWPATVREDLCQDLVVAVLSGETTVDELQNGFKYYVNEVFKNHPLKYGRFSLSQNSGKFSCAKNDSNDERHIDCLTHEDIDAAKPHRTWLADQDIDFAPGDESITDDDDIDPEVREVMLQDQHPQWRRRFSDKAPR